MTDRHPCGCHPGRKVFDMFTGRAVCAAERESVPPAPWPGGEPNPIPDHIREQARRFIEPMPSSAALLESARRYAGKGDTFHRERVRGIVKGGA